MKDFNKNAFQIINLTNDIIKNMNDAPVWKMCLENFNSQIPNILAKAFDKI